MREKNELSKSHPTRRDTIETFGKALGASMLAPLLPGCGSGSTSVASAAEPLLLRPSTEILLVPGFMSELYEQVSNVLQADISQALRDLVRPIEVRIPLPFPCPINIPIGYSIARALPDIELPFPKGGFISFDSQMRRYDADGTAYANISRVSTAFNSEESVGHNAAAIDDYISKSEKDKRFVIVSHSKGGLDTLDALIQNPKLEAKVTGWVALQAPFFGSPVANLLPSALSNILLGALGGNGQSLDDLKTTTRADYMVANVDAIAGLTKRVPVISLYSTYRAIESVEALVQSFAASIISGNFVEDMRNILMSNSGGPIDIPRIVADSTDAILALIRQRVQDTVAGLLAQMGLMDLFNVAMLELLGLENDGLVPADSAMLPGSTLRRGTPDADHAAPVMVVDPLKNFWTEAHRNATTHALVEEVQQMAQDA